MAKVVTCHYVRALFLEINVEFSGNFEQKFEKFTETFPNALEKEPFRRKLKDLTAYVKAKAACVGESRKSYLKLFGHDAWSSLSKSEQDLHSVTCDNCTTSVFFKEPLGHRNKYKRKRPPTEECTPPKKATRAEVLDINNKLTEVGRRWEKKYDGTFVDFIRKNKVLNMTPRKTKVQKQRKKRKFLRKVSLII